MNKLKPGRLVYVLGTMPAIVISTNEHTVELLPLDGYPERLAGHVFTYSPALVYCFW